VIAVVLFEKWAGIVGFDSEGEGRDPDKLIGSVAALERSFGGVNLEDIKAPECFGIERTLRARMNIPVFHDDQHGTAIIVAAAVLNGLEVVGKTLGTARLVCSGAGAAALACLNLLCEMGMPREHVTVCDIEGVVYKGREVLMDPYKAAFAQETADRTLGEAIESADRFPWLSAPEGLKPQMVAPMAPSPALPLADPIRRADADMGLSTYDELTALGADPLDDGAPLEELPDFEYVDTSITAAPPYQAPSPPPSTKYAPPPHLVVEEPAPVADATPEPQAAGIPDLSQRIDALLSPSTPRPTGMLRARHPGASTQTLQWFDIAQSWHLNHVSWPSPEHTPKRQVWLHVNDLSASLSDTLEALPRWLEDPSRFPGRILDVDVDTTQLIDHLTETDACVALAAQDPEGHWYSPPLALRTPPWHAQDTPQLLEQPAIVSLDARVADCIKLARWSLQDTPPRVEDARRLLDLARTLWPENVRLRAFERNHNHLLA